MTKREKKGGHLTQSLYNKFFGDKARGDEEYYQLSPTASLHLIELQTEEGLTLLVEIQDKAGNIQWAVGVNVNSLEELHQIKNVLGNKEELLSQGKDIDSIIATVYEKLYPFSEAKYAIFYGKKSQGEAIMNKKFHRAANFNEFYARLKHGIVLKYAKIDPQDVYDGVQTMVTAYDTGASEVDAVTAGLKYIATEALRDEKDAERKTMVEAIARMSSVVITSQIYDVLKSSFPDYIAVLQSAIDSANWPGILQEIAPIVYNS